MKILARGSACRNGEPGYDRIVLTKRMLLRGPGVSVAEVRCSGGGPGWSPEELVRDFGVVLVRSGMFRRSVDGVEALADPSGGYMERPGSVQRIAHPCGGDVCTAIAISPAVLGELEGTAGRDAEGSVITSSRTDASHRMLLARAFRGAGEFELTERTLLLVGEVLSTLRERTESSSIGSESRRAVEEARAALAENQDLSLLDLARKTGVSAYHLSRTFHRVAGITLSRYRIRLRVRRALERLAEGERDLARLALDLGFADQAHLTRSVREETGATPRRLRAILDKEP